MSLGDFYGDHQMAIISLPGAGKYFKTIGLVEMQLSGCISFSGRQEKVIKKTGVLMFKVARSLYALAYCGIYKYQDWHKWADKLILDNSELDLWIYDVSMAHDFTALSEAIGERIELENWSEYPSYTITELILGGYYYMYKSNNITLYELIEQSGRVSDGGDVSKDCEYFYKIMNEIDKQHAVEKSYELLKELDNYLEPLRQEIMSRKKCIETCSYEDIII